MKIEEICQVCPNKNVCKSQTYGKLPAHSTDEKIASNNFCMCKCPSGFLCCLERGHKSNHKAFISNGIVAIWENVGGENNENNSEG